jgi:hypothetical protein
MAKRAGPAAFTSEGFDDEMMIQIPQELAVKIAGTFRGMPALMALLLINTLFMGFVAWALWVSSGLRYQERAELLKVVDRCLMQQGR